MANEKLAELVRGLDDIVAPDGMRFTAEIVEGEIPLIRVAVEDREEFPIYLTVDDDQILCTTYLWKESEINPATRVNLLEDMLTMNLPMPLSSFGKVGDQYLIFGAMAIGSRMEDIQHEIRVLSDNTLNAVETMGEYLNPIS
uniref:DUF2170 domain-containing protein n=1 Tax=Candidatus Kentrum sp. MB TaxID=2138164 RepID=A0A451BCI5_9GAMM|nr:MAG: hypothetical protein BECKMB1821G_GA0114241_103532 [Candidatus Kentron sp. MB]VFK32517.1 MAG: hypothetical protein BECKMB1821I_GA0114274_10348 [Candidatus Kentron sp. MB]VFK75955.1 MAG: hypothetical protein BECKMB1821H_GA0114242_10378 [Candidatus Kentron sp. MB]